MLLPLQSEIPTKLVEHGDTSGARADTGGSAGGSKRTRREAVPDLCLTTSKAVWCPEVVPRRVRFETHRTSQHGERSRAARARLDGRSEDLADALATTVHPRGQSFLVYDHTKNTSQTKSCKDDIGRAYAVLKTLKAACPELASKRSQVRQALDIVYKRNQHEPKWQVAPKDHPQCLTMLTNCNTNLPRAMRQGEQRQPTTTWVVSMPWNQASTASSSHEPQGRTECTYGYDMELQQAWRLPGKHPEGARRKSTKNTTSKCSSRASSWSPHGRTNRSG